MCSCAIYPISNVYNMPIIHNLSNHAAILLSTEGPVSRVKHSFKFENWWIKEQDFQDHAKTAWFSYLNKLFFLPELIILQVYLTSGAKGRSHYIRSSTI
jgi:hypothetical protein